MEYCLNKGYVKLIDVMPSQNAEKRIAQCARISFDNFDVSKSDQEDRALVRYLYENYHTSPLEMVEFMFEIYCPQFVATHFHRHRTANINEQSQRYTEILDDMYCPSVDVRKQSKSNKQGSEEDEEFHRVMEGSMLHIEETINNTLLPQYHNLVQQGVAKEIARAYLPRALYTKMVYKMDANNLLKLLRLRCAPDAQKETRVYANAIKELVKPHIPTLIQCLDESMQSLTLRPDELEHIKNSTYPTSVRRKKEYLDKYHRLFSNTIMVLLCDDGTIRDIVLEGSDIRKTFANVPFILPKLRNPVGVSWKDLDCDDHKGHDIVVSDIKSVQELEELKNKYSNVITVKLYNHNYIKDQTDLMSYKADYLIAHMEDYGSAIKDYY